MRAVTIARNYADTLFELAGQSSATEAWGDLMDVTAAAFETPSIEAMLMSPRVSKAEKVRIVSEALHDAPRPFVLFLVAVIHRGRQMLLGMIADEYRELLDQQLGRVRAGITLAREVDATRRDEIVARLAKALDKDVIAGFVVDPAILGGAVVKVGSQVYDGSVRKRLGRLRRQLL